MKKYILKISHIAFFVMLATVLVPSPKAYCNTPSTEQFISQEICLVDQAVDRVVGLFKTLFKTKMLFRDAVTSLSTLTTTVEHKIVNPLESQVTRSSDKGLHNASNLVHVSYQMLCNIEHIMKSLVGCRDPKTFRSKLELIERNLSSQFTELSRDLNQFYSESKQTEYAKDIQKLLQTIKRSENTGVSRLTIFNRIYDFIKEA